MPSTASVLTFPTASQAVPGAVTVAQAATRLGVSVRTVRRWVDRGRLSTLSTRDGQTLLSGEAVGDLRARVTTDPACLLW